MKANPANINTNALFFQLNIQNMVRIKYKIISTGNPKESRLNHGKIFGGT
ncbi:hypothetical protein HMPREF0204_10181 [Chryseobacterium gleum ATCC 35910]|uniref:Uncharacterized protein n=1 Tax=Chryseobacterium gleum ATCC 35910 TaxID=525257 RepID=A0ABP2IUD0_CHRGE|nr:hypothetical protein HMPREF0204_10181 [Chryseobacterium gleum ATCC 35910]